MTSLTSVDEAFRVQARKLESPQMGTEAIAPLLHGLVMLHRPRRILEIGGGLTSLYLLKGLADVEASDNAQAAIADDLAPLRNRNYFSETKAPSQLHMIDSLVHHHTSAGLVIEAAQQLGLERFLTVHEADFRGYAERLSPEVPPFEMVWFDCGSLDYFQHFREAYWPLVSRRGGLILMHSLATNLHGQLFLSQLKLEQATRSFDQFEVLTLVEPHKLRQNSVTLVRLIGDLDTTIHSVMP